MPEEPRWMFLGFIQFLVSGVHGQVNSICALRGSSVSLPCSVESSTSTPKWYTVYIEDTSSLTSMLRIDGYNITYDVGEKNNFTITIKDLKDSDANVYCCTDVYHHCINRTELVVADLQVKVIPATEGQAVSLMCNSSCALTETETVVYIWYKNGEDLYEDESPWYQELVSSEEGVRYSCAIKGYEHLRAPDVSVGSVTPTCFTVTYAKGRLCSYQQTSEEEPCTITYPREIRVQRKAWNNYGKLTCDSRCVASQTAYRWYWKRKLIFNCESKNMTVFFSYNSIFFSCAVKGNEDLLSEEVCIKDNICLSVKYVSRRICALENSSVNISSKYPANMVVSVREHKFWYKINRRGEVSAETLRQDAGRVEYHDDDRRGHHTLRINDVKKNDSAEYTFSQIHWKELFDSPGVMLVVTGLRVTMIPSAVVTEGQRVTLTCSTSCPLTADYMWYMNGQPVPLSHSKRLVLDPVSVQHGGNYSCVVVSPHNVRSAEETLTVKAREKSVLIINATKLAVLLIMPALFLLCVWTSRKKTPTLAAKLNDKVQTDEMDPLYEAVTVRPAEQQEDAM